ncbi:hypothetical protein [Aestuariirhabdus litorea]|uniref:Uncharacterized protein n=1 Tax=Aestuariirhabdus litorea TaxID=2528527 RepID=A0A3P3VQJ7_9GAMM|nr:hypothetical protein [Aestuariirhabdus litorea]RRJ83926.1 hypothetical protein D0544_02050 [Aestuariirhabdus litorea]RWW97148.1 hypothetical protein DZC74_02055 [Endozoicomonadaceae bacterium GTF-13]
MSSNENPDLFWDLSAISNKQLASNFFKKVASAFCVYSPSVEKIYSNFEVILPRDSNSGLIVLPNPYAFHDMFSFINNASIKQTGIMLHPGESFGHQGGLYLSLPMRGNKRSKMLEFVKGINLINNTYKAKPGNQLFLPVLVNGDLREFKAAHPYLHLHRIDVAELGNLSQFERQDIQDSIYHRFKQIDKLLVAPTA